VIAAPKNSFWNHVPALIGIGLLLAAAQTGPGRDHMTRWLLVAWYGLAWVQVLVNGLSGPTLQALGPIGAILSSSALVGMVVAWLALGRALLRVNPRSEAAPTPD
jgi:hypothetical protein